MQMKTKRRREESPQRAPRTIKTRRRDIRSCQTKVSPEPHQPDKLGVCSGDTLDLSNNYTLNKQRLSDIKKSLPRLRSLNLEFCHTLSDEDFASMVGYELVPSTKVLEAVDDTKTFSLESLNLARTKISDAGVAAIIVRCEEVRHLRLSHTRITDLSLSLIAQHCKRLVTLDVSGCDIGNYGIQLIAQECKYLADLKVNECTRINDGIIPYVCFYCPELNQLGIRNTKITARGLNTLLQKRKFSYLDLEALPITDAQLYLISLQQSQNIKSLRLSYCFNLTAGNICRLINICKHLAEVHLFGLSLGEELFSSVNREGLHIFSC
eukprot:TRINITY_DN8992_c0_g1_i1.p1 TRINITY_DN8992_c0_g1~~TRINITY_DN8992_c0_g1_i1.p1  ORF type:complete len:323 (-),score=23.05 TRINITY_DN8992_c0_g1_i1:64-1032(-)